MMIIFITMQRCGLAFSALKNFRCCRSPLYGLNSPKTRVPLQSYMRFCASNKRESKKLTQEERMRIYKENMRRIQEKSQTKNSNVGKIGIMIVIGVVGLSYASVPLYQMFCSATGYGGTALKIAQDKSVSSLADKSLRPERPLRIKFAGQASASIPWRFTPLQNEVTCVPGESVLAFYNATNTSDETVIGLSIYNVVPSKASIYFNKVQCFCFEEQRLEAGESVDMPVLFFIDPEFADDPNLADISDLTLSYTFFKVSGDIDIEEMEQALKEGQDYAEEQAKLLKKS